MGDGHGRGARGGGWLVVQKRRGIVPRQKGIYLFWQEIAVKGKRVGALMAGTCLRTIYIIIPDDMSATNDTARNNEIEGIL